MRNRNVRMVLAAVALTCCARPPALRLDATRRVVLDTSDVSAASRPCSRPWPTNIGGVWRPTAGDVARADTLVVTELARRLSGVRWWVPRPDSLRPHASDYYRQYVGILIAGQRVLYVNGFHRDLLRFQKDTLDWTRRFLNVCDGGELLFGAEVWLQRRVVRQFVFNGRA